MSLSRDIWHRLKTGARYNSRVLSSPLVWSPTHGLSHRSRYGRTPNEPLEAALRHNSRMHADRLMGERVLVDLAVFHDHGEVLGRIRDQLDVCDRVAVNE